MAALGIAPRPRRGAGVPHLLELRMDHGPLSEDDARAELLRWWAEQPESAAPA